METILESHFSNNTNSFIYSLYKNDFHKNKFDCLKKVFNCIQTPSVIETYFEVFSKIQQFLHGMRRFIHIINIFLISINLIVIFYYFFLFVWRIPAFNCFNRYASPWLKFSIVVLWYIQKCTCFVKICYIACLFLFAISFKIENSCARFSTWAKFNFAFCKFFCFACTTNIKSEPKKC